ncbi:MAG TPA: hypothetical protein VGB55_15445, partial [Tepidisphaeraceae bacterium]
MRIWLTAFLAGIFLLRPAVSLAQSAEAIDAAIENGKKYLYSQLQSNGTWETTPSSTGPEKAGDVTGSQWGGRTALATYALLTCGEKPSDPKLKPAIEFLQKQQQINGTYVTAIKCLVWLNLPETPEVKAAMRRDAAALRATMKPQKQGLPVWDYGPSARSAYSLSRSQYGALGLWAATEMNVEVPVEVWRSIERTWETAQAPDGGWRYKIPADMENDVKTNITTLSMTASGLATMYVTQDFTRADTYSNPRGNAKSPHIEKG